MADSKRKNKSLDADNAQNDFRPEKRPEERNINIDFCHGPQCDEHKNAHTQVSSVNSYNMRELDEGDFDPAKHNKF